ncbi:hypothetical protein PM082_009886 [Marasmius tenuissimus]|nr:hypothetical protein PM082_009886 [Marasmius tenuissimus]
MMQGANNAVLAHTRQRKINLHISWPSYKHVPWCRSIDIIMPVSSEFEEQELGFFHPGNFFSPKLKM